MRLLLDLCFEGKSLLSRELGRGSTIVGCNPECDLCIPQGEIEPVQFILRRENLKLWLKNRSESGTRITCGGVDEVITDECRLADGDSIVLGNLVGHVRFVDSDSPGQTETLHRTATAPEKKYSICLPEQFPGELWELHGEGTRLGSGPGMDIVLGDAYVSSQHVEFFIRDGHCVLRDLGSRNGVFVGGKKVSEAEVEPGADIQVGKTRIVIVGESEARVPKVVRKREGVPSLIGSSAPMRRVLHMIERMAPHDAPVLIMGETGTGKEVVARLLATSGTRARQSFVPINCGGLPRNLMESELFGHEKGAFTGAVSQKRGAFEEADGGTLFLDEVGELPLEMQPQLLRALENGEIRRVGSTRSFGVNVRFIAATNRTLEKEVAEGRFREDLFHRLHVLAIQLPPLRERGGDVDELIAFFMNDLVPLGDEVEMSKEARDKLRAYRWPGNIRELRNVLQRAILMRESPGIIGEEDIEFIPSTLVTRTESLSAMGSRTLADLEKEAIVNELARHGGNKKEAAAALGVSRSTIHRKLDEYGIEV